MDKQNKKIPQLCGKDLCTACHACYNICSKKAIIMVEDQYGELHPQIDDNLCVKCGMCEKVCPELKQNNLHRNGEPKIYACWLKNSEHRKRVLQEVLHLPYHLPSFGKEVMYGVQHTEKICI